MKAQDIEIGQSFEFKNQTLTRVTFEGKPTVVYRCTVNIVALDEQNNVVFVEQRQDIAEFSGGEMHGT